MEQLWNNFKCLCRPVFYNKTSTRCLKWIRINWLVHLDPQNGSDYPEDLPDPLADMIILQKRAKKLDRPVKQQLQRCVVKRPDLPILCWIFVRRLWRSKFLFNGSKKDTIGSRNRFKKESSFGNFCRNNQFYKLVILLWGIFNFRKGIPSDNV